MALSDYYANQTVISGTDGFVTGFIPHDFNSLKSCVLRFNPQINDLAWRITINVMAGAVNELYNTMTSGPVDHDVNVTQYEVFEVNITDDMPDGIAANDYFGVNINNALGPNDLYFMGMNLTYLSTNVQDGIVHEIEKFYHAPEGIL